jgi:small subunit ribosomal protein S20
VAHSISAKKRIRQNLRARSRNRARKDLIKFQVKAFTSALGSGDEAKAREELNKTVQRLDWVAAKGTIHKNAAARKRSRLTRRLNAMVAAAKAAPEGKAPAKKGKGTKAATA